MENIEVLHTQISLAWKIAVSHKNNIFNDRKQISAQPVINRTTGQGLILEMNCSNLIFDCFVATDVNCKICIHFCQVEQNVKK